MSGWEYKVVPAPKKGIKAAGVKGPEGRFANAIEMLMNDMGAEGWEYQRAETLPSIERAGLTGSVTEWRNLLVFRRAVAAPMDAFEPELLPAPSAEDTPPQAREDATAQSQATDAMLANTTKAAPDASPQAPTDAEKHAMTAAKPAKTVDKTPLDNGVEDTSDMGDMTTSLKNLASQRNSAKTAD